MAASSFFFLSLALSFAALACVYSDVHYYEFVVRESNFTRLCESKSIPVVNDCLPGPSITVHRGDTLYVNFFNLANYGVTLHWHGVKQPRNPWYDGPEYITQCPVQPGSNFTYEVFFTDEEGTLWWHAHSDWTRATVHGIISILPPPTSTYPFPTPHSELHLVLASWFKTDLMYMKEQVKITGGKTNISDAYSINGQLGDFYNCSKENTTGLVVEGGKTYLVRILNAGLNVDFYVVIAGHEVTVVGAEGTYYKPFRTSYIFIVAGQTMDVLLTADQAPSHYYIIAKPYFDGGADDYDHTITSAILTYEGHYVPPSLPLYPDPLPSTSDITTAMSFIHKARSLATPDHPLNLPLQITTRIFMVLSLNVVPCPNNSCAGPMGYRVAAAINNSTFFNPHLSILEAYYWNVSNVYTTDFPDRPEVPYNYTADYLLTLNVTMSKSGTRVKVLEYNESVEIILQGSNVLNSSENHPVHIHGFTFYILGRGHGIFDPNIDPLSYNLVDPPEGNLVVLPKDGWATIRFRAANPGVWYLHCHFDKHMTYGMTMTFIVKDGGTESTSVRKAPSYMPSCVGSNISSIVVGNQSFGVN